MRDCSAGSLKVGIFLPMIFVHFIQKKKKKEKPTIRTGTLTAYSRAGSDLSILEPPAVPNRNRSEGITRTGATRREAISRLDYSKKSIGGTQHEEYK